MNSENTPDAREALRAAEELLRQGRVDEVQKLCQQLLAAEPDNDDALTLSVLASARDKHWMRADSLISDALNRAPSAARYRLRGRVRVMLNRPRDALDAFEQARLLEPDRPEEAEILVARALALKLLNRPDEALEAAERGRQLEPDHARGHFIRGVILTDLGRTDEALEAYDAALAHRPEFPEAWVLRGDLLFSDRRFEQSLTAYDQVLVSLEESTNSVMSHIQFRRANALYALGRWSEAVVVYDEVLTLSPQFPAAFLNRGTALLGLGRIHDALDSYDQALRCLPSSSEAHLNRGNALCRLGRYEDALAAYDTAIRFYPRYAEAYNNRAQLMHDIGRTREALADVDHAISLKSGYAEAHAQRGYILTEQGRTVEAGAAYREALKLRPDFPEARSSYLLCLNYDPHVEEAELFEAAREWGRRHANGLPSRENHTNAAVPDKTLRIGLVSAHFGRHPTGYLLESALHNSDRESVEFFCYACSNRDDDVTARLRSSSRAWRTVGHQSDRELYETVCQDGIDILVDLGGHTRNNRLRCFALRPAPVQVTWLASPFTTGMRAMDYILMDPIYVPSSDDQWFTETVIRLPGLRWVYAPPYYAPDVAETPALRRGYVTFGSSSHSLAKVNVEVVALWARVLDAVPDSRLVISANNFRDAGERDRLRTLFVEHGVDPGRIDATQGADSDGSLYVSGGNLEFQVKPLEGRHVTLLRNYKDIDIVLDTFPVSGGLSTCESLWMGVPVITLPGRRPASRQTLGFLHALQRTEWAAADAEEYVRIAAQMASDVERLADLRRTQREHMVSSPVCDGFAFARQLEDALRTMWRDWCQSIR